jgi:hypothetical protein
MLEIPNNLVRKLNLFQDAEPKIVNHLRKIRQAVRKKENRARFYRIKGTPIVGGVESKEFIETLEELQERFVEAELYELAQECDNLIKEIHINKLITETQK